MNEPKTIDYAESFKSQFLKIMIGIKYLEDELYEDYVADRSKIELVTMKKSYFFKQKYLGIREDERKVNSTHEHSIDSNFEVFDLSDKIKNNNFDANNISIVLNLPFSSGTSNEFKDYIQDLESFRIRISDLFLLSKSIQGRENCQKKTLDFDFKLDTINDIKLIFK